MFQKDSSDYVLAFDLRDTDIGWKVDYQVAFFADWRYVAYNQHVTKHIMNDFIVTPAITDTDYIIQLNHTHYPQYLMLRHLAWDDIINYFQNI